MLTKEIFLKRTIKFLFCAMNYPFPLLQQKIQLQRHSWRQVCTEPQLHWSNCSPRPLYVVKEWLGESQVRNRTLSCCERYLTVPAKQINPFLACGIPWTGFIVVIKAKNTEIWSCKKGDFHLVPTFQNRNILNKFNSEQKSNQHFWS